MFNAKNGKRSIILLAIVCLVSALTLSVAGFSSVAAEEGSLDDFLVNGDAARNFYTGSEYEETDEVLAILEQIGTDGRSYYDNLQKVEGASLDDLFVYLDEYAQLCEKIGQYNTAAVNGKQYPISLQPTFTYRDSSWAQSDVESDITGRVAAKAIETLSAKAKGWNDVTEYSYPVKYTVMAGDTPIFEVLSDPYGDSEVFPLAEGYNYVENLNNASRGVLNMVIDDNGTRYTLVISLEIGNVHADNLDYPRLVKDVKINAIYEGATTEGTKADGRYTVVLDENYTDVAASCGKILEEGKKAINNATAADMRSEYDYYTNLIKQKIDSLKEIAGNNLLRAKLKAVANEALYTDEDNAKILEAYDNAKAALDAADSLAETNAALSDGIAAIEAIQTIPSTFRVEYKDLFVPDKYYIDNEYDLAVEALGKLNGYNAAVKAELADERAILIANVKMTAKARVAEKAEDIKVDNFASNQLRQIQEKRIAAEKKIDEAADDFDAAAIDAAVKEFETYIQGASSFGTKKYLEKDGVKVEGTFDANAELTAATVQAAEDANADILENFNTNKKNSIETRKLSVLDVYEITVSVDGKELVYNGGTEYKVTIVLTEKTINKFRMSGVDPDSVVVTYIDKNGNVEIKTATLYFRYSEGGELVEYTEGGSVDWDKITGGSIMFVTQHFSSYSLMGNTSNLGLARVSNLLAGIWESQLLVYIGIAIGAVVGVILLFILISLIVSACKRYKIKFNSNGGTKVKSIKKKYGKKLPELKTPVKEGYVFTGWCIDEKLKYEFNRSTMPRANTVLYARWMTEEEYAALQAKTKVGDKAELIGYYDSLRAKLAACKKPEVEGERVFVKQDVLAKIYAEDDVVKLLVKTKPECIKLKNGKYYIVKEADKFETYEVTDELSLEAALDAIDKMAALNGLVVEEAHDVEPSTYEDALLGYAYIIKYEDVADADGRYRALREHALSFVGTLDKCPHAKLLFELLPEGTTLNLGLAVSDPEMYSNILENKKTAGALDNVYVITEGEQMGVALELIALVLKENGFIAGKPAPRDDEFDTSLAYCYATAGYVPVEQKIEEPVEEVPAEEPVEEAAEEVAEEPVEEPAEEPVEVEEVVEEPVEEVEEAAEEPVEEPVEEITLDVLFKKYRVYVRSFTLYGDGEATDRSNDGAVILSAKLGEENIETILDPKGDAEAITFSTADEFEDVKKKVAAVMAKYGMIHGEEGSIDDLTADINAFDYKIKFPELPTPEELMKSLRDYINSFALFGENVDKSIDGTVVVKAALKDGAVAVTLDPYAEAQELTVTTDSELAAAKEAVAAVMAKYGLEVDPNFVPAEGLAGDTFGYRIKF